MRARPPGGQVAAEVEVTDNRPMRAVCTQRDRRRERASGRPWLRAGLAGLVLAVAVAACGGGGGTADPAPAAKSAVEYLVDYLRDWYLWSDALPASIDPADYADATAALAALRVGQDRYSYIETQATYDAFFDAGQALGFGVGYEVQADSIALWMVQPDAPAHAAGLRRGDRIVAIDGTSIAELVAQGRLAEAFGADAAGVSARFSVRRPAGDQQITVSKAWYPLRYVLATADFDVGGRRVGYVSLYSFGAPTAAAWRTALDGLASAGVRDLIVDLRDNGGGLLASAAEVGSALGVSGLGGRLMSRLRFNSRHPEAQQDVSFTDDPLAGRFERLVWLTSERTCSAAEALIAGLQPFRAATRIGATTCGKPVGFTPPRYAGLVFSVVSFAIVNAEGVGDYFDGLAPTCPVTDPLSGQLGVADEPLLAAALSFLASGNCPIADASGRLKSVRTRAPARGIATESGLH